MIGVKREKREREKKKTQDIDNYTIFVLFLIGGEKEKERAMIREKCLLIFGGGREQENHQLVIRYRVNSDNSVGSVTCMRG